MQLSYTTLDVFTKTPLLGNPVAIVKVPASITLPQDVKQAIAREYNLSEIVFLHHQTDEDVERKEARIDIFTSQAEVPFAGHPTIGSANYLLHYEARNDITALVTKAGRKTISKSDMGVAINLAHNVHIHNSPFPDTAFAHHPVVSIVKGMTFILARLNSLQELAMQSENLLGARNTYNQSGKLDEGWREGVVTTFCYVDLGTDEGVRRLRTRMFGSREDPGTGSASSALCCYLALTEKGDVLRKFHLTQGVEMGKQCDIFVEVTLNESGGAIEKVQLGGTAVKVMDGVLYIPNV